MKSQRWIENVATTRISRRPLAMMDENAALEREDAMTPATMMHGSIEQEERTQITIRMRKEKPHRDTVMRMTKLPAEGVVAADEEEAAAVEANTRIREKQDRPIKRVTHWRIHQPLMMITRMIMRLMQFAKGSVPTPGVGNVMMMTAIPRAAKEVEDGDVQKTRMRKNVHHAAEETKIPITVKNLEVSVRPSPHGLRPLTC